MKMLLVLTMFCSYNCACNIGFEGTGRICEDINECETGDNTCTGFDALCQNF